MTGSNRVAGSPNMDRAAAGRSPGHGKEAGGAAAVGASAAEAAAEGSSPAVEAGLTHSPLHTTPKAELPSASHGATADNSAAAAKLLAEDSNQAAEPTDVEPSDGMHSKAVGELPAKHDSWAAASGDAGLSEGLHPHAVKGLPAEHGSQAGAPGADNDGQSSDGTRSLPSGELQDIDVAGASAAEMLLDDELAGALGEYIGQVWVCRLRLLQLTTEVQLAWLLACVS